MFTKQKIFRQLMAGKDSVELQIVLKELKFKNEKRFKIWFNWWGFAEYYTIEDNKILKRNALPHVKKEIIELEGEVEKYSKINKSVYKILKIYVIFYSILFPLGVYFSDYPFSWKGLAALNITLLIIVIFCPFGLTSLFNRRIHRKSVDNALYIDKNLNDNVQNYYDSIFQREVFKNEKSKMYSETVIQNYFNMIFKSQTEYNRLDENLASGPICVVIANPLFLWLVGGQDFLFLEPFYFLFLIVTTLMLNMASYIDMLCGNILHRKNTFDNCAANFLTTNFDDYVTKLTLDDNAPMNFKEINEKLDLWIRFYQILRFKSDVDEYWSLSSLLNPEALTYSDIMLINIQVKITAVTEKLEKFDASQKSQTQIDVQQVILRIKNYHELIKRETKYLEILNTSRNEKIRHTYTIAGVVISIGAVIISLAGILLRTFFGI